MIVFLFLPLFVIALFFKILAPKKFKTLNQKHVVITGGSSGIGKSVAILAAQKGAHVTVIARNQDRLKEAQIEIKENRVSDDQIVTTISADVSHRQNINKQLLDLDINIAPIYMLVNCAGIAICGKVEDFTEQDIQNMLNVNYLGTLYPIQCLVPKFKERKEGIIVLTASQAALMGIYGYSIYSSCKFALRGLAESISMELKSYNVSVTVALPPDTDTPGFEKENKTKPEETTLISESGALMKPEIVAKKLIEDALAENFFSFVGFESYILTTLCVGMSPFASFFEVLVQSIILGPLRLIAAYYRTSFDKIINKCYVERQKIKGE